MGQGTTVPYNYDIDLVLYSSKWREQVLKILAEQTTKREEGRQTAKEATISHTQSHTHHPRKFFMFCIILCRLD